MDYRESLDEQEVSEERNLPEAEDDLLQARMLAQWLVAWVNDNHWTHQEVFVSVSMAGFEPIMGL